MNKLSRKFRKKSSASLHNTEENDNKQTKISSFFGKPNQEIFKTPDPKKVLEDKNVIEQSPNDSDLVSKKARRLFGLKQQTSKVGKLFTNASTSSLLSGNLEKKATIVQSPPKSKDDFAKKRHLSPETASNEEVKVQKLSESPTNFPTTNQTVSTPTSSISKENISAVLAFETPKSIALTDNLMNTEALNDEDENFTKLKSPIKNKANKKCEITPTQIIDEDSCSPKRSQTTFPKKPLQIVSKETLSAAYGRHLVEEVEETPSAIVLTLTDLTSELKRICHLKGSWMETQVKPKDIVNILSVNVNDTKGITIDDMNGLIVVNPDFLVSGTSIVSTLFCMRKAVLNERFKGQEGSSRSMLIGTLVHELLQESLKRNLRSPVQVARQLESCLESDKILKELLLLNMTKDEIYKEVEPFLPHIMFFIEKYVLGNVHVEVPTVAYQYNSQQKTYGNKTQIWPGKVEAIMDIEENIWSPRLGIKGKVDLTIQVKLKQKDAKGRICKTMPLELKTGRPSGSAEHRGQVILYSMMMSERRPDPESGLLLYLRTSSVQEVRAGIHEMRGLIQLRNQLVYPLLAEKQLPGPINAKRACKECSHLTSCSMYQKLENNIPPEPHAMSELVPTVLDHLTSEDVEFFNKWSTMNSLESGEARKGSKLKSMWCMTPLQRESQGSAISELKVIKSDFPIVTFGKSNNRPLGSSLNVFQPGEFVIISSATELAIAQGTVLSIDSLTTIKLSLDKPINVTNNTIFVMDKYEYVSGGSGNWTNLAKLMSNNPKAKNLRDIIIAKNPAEFVSGLSKETALLAKPIVKPMKLNAVQSKAIFKILMAKHYALCLGMPGSGKTTLIVALVRLLVKMGKSVLLTAYTHSAVDNVLVKLLKANQDQTCFLRLGRSNRVHEKIREFSEEYLIKAKNMKQVEDIDRLYQSQPVIATTCLGANNHPAFVDRTFDYCIVDEAGQSLLLSAIGPLFHAEKFVLVGDPMQLPPVVQSSTAKSMGMDQSLFSLLQTPENTVPLSLQYRMNQSIQDIANFMTYEGHLECGNDQVANQQTVLKVNAPGDLLQWPSFFPREFRNKSVVFFDTTAPSSTMFESKDDLGICNHGEANFVGQLAKLAKKMEVVDGGKVDENDSYRENCASATVGIIAPYRAQVGILRKLLSPAVFSFSDINTVDQFQGRDKDIIIYSCTRTTIAKKNNTSEKKNVEETIMNDWRRLNVAVTRPKSRLWIVGNVEALETYEPFRKLLEYLKQKDYICTISMDK